MTSRCGCSRRLSDVIHTRAAQQYIVDKIYWLQYIVLICLTIAIYCTGLVANIVYKKKLYMMMLNCLLLSEHSSDNVSKRRKHAASAPTRASCFQHHVRWRDFSPWQSECSVLRGVACNPEPWRRCFSLIKTSHCEIWL